ncbi:MAG: YggU family protein [Gammaproteobacteria bacterium]|nr:YggU family protein [Gammaproteobacteria bacterium]
MVGIVNKTLKIRITAPPVDGKANSHLIKYLAKTFGVAKTRVKLVSGDNNRNKRLRIHSPNNLPAGISQP